MERKDEAVIDMLIEIINDVIPCLKDKNYDFGKLDSELIFKFEELKKEKEIQYKINKLVEEKVRDKFRDYFEIIDKLDDFDKNYDGYFKNTFRIVNYMNYYFVYFYGFPCFDVKFVFDKNGNLLFENIIIHCLDSENILIIKHDVEDKVFRLNHYKLKDNRFELINFLDNIYNIDNDYSNLFKKDRLVVCSCGNGDKLLYNYKNAKVVISSFSIASSNLGELKKFKYGDDKEIRLIKKIFFKSELVSKLEFLVSEFGRIDDNVPIWDFENNCFYYLDKNGEQCERLNFIYDKVKNKYNSNQIVIKKKVLK